MAVVAAGAAVIAVVAAGAALLAVEAAGAAVVAVVVERRSQARLRWPRARPW